MPLETLQKLLSELPDNTGLATEQKSMIDSLKGMLVAAAKSRVSNLPNDMELATQQGVEDKAGGITSIGAAANVISGMVKWLDLTNPSHPVSESEEKEDIKKDVFK